MTELLKEATRAFKAVADVLEFALTQEKMKAGIIIAPAPTPAAAEAEQPAAKPARKPRAPREEKHEAPAATTAAPLAEMSDEQSKDAVQAAAKLLVMRFNKPGAVGPSGQAAPEGFHMAKEILRKDFNVNSTKDLAQHAQRLQFVAKVKQIIADADRAPQNGAARETADAGIGI